MIKTDKSHFRIMRTKEIREINSYVWGAKYAIGQYERKASFAKSVPMAYGIFDAEGCGSIVRRDYTEFMDLIYKPDRRFPSKLVNLLNVKYVISAEPIKDDSYEVVYKGKLTRFPIIDNGKVYNDFYINRNNACMDRVFFAREARAAKDREEALRLVGEEGFDPARVVVLEEPPHPGLLRFARPAERDPAERRKEEARRDNDESPVIERSARITSYEPEEVIVEASTPEPSYLVLSDSYYPGWKVFVDGREEKLYRADYLLRAVYLDRGEHSVKFVYDPISYRIGKVISLITLGLLFLYFFIFRPTISA